MRHKESQDTAESLQSTETETGKGGSAKVINTKVI